MIVIWVLGALDFLAGLMAILYQYELIPTRLLISFILYLFVKGIIFRGDLASFIDIIIAIYLIMMIFLPITILTYIAAIYLFQKSIRGFLG